MVRGAASDAVQTETGPPGGRGSPAPGPPAEGEAKPAARSVINDCDRPPGHPRVEFRELPDEVRLVVGHVIDDKVNTPELPREGRNDVHLVSQTEVPAPAEPPGNGPARALARREAPGRAPTVGRAAGSRREVDRVEGPSTVPLERGEEVRRGDPRGDPHLDDVFWSEEAGNRVELERGVDLDVRRATGARVLARKMPEQLPVGSRFLDRGLGDRERPKCQPGDPRRIGVVLDLHVRPPPRRPTPLPGSPPSPSMPPEALPSDGRHGLVRTPR